MEVLTYTSYKEYCELYTKIHDLVVVNSCQVGLARKDNFTINIAVIFYKAGSRTAVEDNNFMKFTLPAGTYSIGDFNTKVKVAV